MEELFDGDARGGVLAIPGEIVGEFAVEFNFSIGDLLEDEDRGELFGERSDTEFRLRSVGSAGREVGVADAVRVKHRAVASDEDGAVEVAELGVAGDEGSDASGCFRRGPIGLGGKREGEDGKHCQNYGSEAGLHWGKAYRFRLG